MYLLVEYPVCDQLSCSNGACFNASQHCDGKVDCRDASDETNCTHGCSNTQFQCGNGECIPRAFVCDHDDDCGDRSDEHSCTYATCKGNFFTCPSGRCIHQTWICDGDDDCEDNADEFGCEKRHPASRPQCAESRGMGRTLWRAEGLEANTHNPDAMVALRPCSACVPQGKPWHRRTCPHPMQPRLTGSPKNDSLSRHRSTTTSGTRCDMASCGSRKSVLVLRSCSTGRPYEGSCRHCHWDPVPACSTHTPKSDSLTCPCSTPREPQRRRGGGGFPAQRRIRVPPHLQ
ncbi:UNVERIFIED_CONTAM: hypothetical protein K2H54_041033 [Gekko kuhli]